MRRKKTMECPAAVALAGQMTITAVPVYAAGSEEGIRDMAETKAGEIDPMRQ